MSLHDIIFEVLAIDLALGMTLEDVEHWELQVYEPGAFLVNDMDWDYWGR